MPTIQRSSIYLHLLLLGPLGSHRCSAMIRWLHIRRSLRQLSGSIPWSVRPVSIQPGSHCETYEIPQWYKDAKFGIFIHWGVYSVPAFGSEWYPRQMYIDTERRGDNFFEHHIKTYGPQSKFGYKDFIPQFKAGEVQS